MKYFIIIFISLLILAGVIWLLTNSSVKSDESIANTAKCLKEKGVKFYGASWCGHCNSQKKMFGDSEKFLPYIECSNPDRTTLKECTDAGIDGYPTWVFPDGKRQSGAMTLEQLKEASDC